MEIDKLEEYKKELSLLVEKVKKEKLSEQELNKLEEIAKNVVGLLTKYELEDQLTELTRMILIAAFYDHEEMKKNFEKMKENRNAYFKGKTG